MKIQAWNDIEEFILTEVAQRGDVRADVLLQHSSLGVLKYTGCLHQEEEMAPVFLLDAMTPGGKEVTQFKVLTFTKGRWKLNKFVMWVETF